MRLLWNKIFQSSATARNSEADKPIPHSPRPIKARFNIIIPFILGLSNYISCGMFDCNFICMPACHESSSYSRFQTLQHTARHSNNLPLVSMPTFCKRNCFCTQDKTEELSKVTGYCLECLSSFLDMGTWWPFATMSRLFKRFNQPRIQQLHKVFLPRVMQTEREPAHSLSGS
jgi:hypothetical protein